jgi:putative transposase
MSNYYRDQTKGGTWFFTVVAFERRPIFCLESFRNSLKQSILKTKENHPFKINAWILLPDHLHCVWTLPKNDADFSIRWKLIKQYVTRDCKSSLLKQKRIGAAKKKRRESSIWQRRFWEHKIRSEQDFRTHLDYLHYNPVKHGLCGSPSQWPYSSFHRFQARGVYTEDWATDNPPDINQISDFGEA